MERQKRDLTLSLSFSLLLMRGKRFSAATQRQVCDHKGGEERCGRGGVYASRNREHRREGMEGWKEARRKGRVRRKEEGRNTSRKRDRNEENTLTHTRSTQKHTWDSLGSCVRT